MSDIAVIGCGMSGLSLSQRLSSIGMKVTLYDKSHRPGGRLSTKRFNEDKDESIQFDHGAQFIHAKSPEFINSIKNWDFVKTWEGNFGELRKGIFTPFDKQKNCYVGFPKQSSIGAGLLSTIKNASVEYNTTVSKLQKLSNKNWKICDDKGKVLGEFKRVVITIPAPQAINLIKGVHEEFSKKISNEVKMMPCWSLMFTLPKNQLNNPFDSSRVKDSPISWIARNNSKPGRPDNNIDCWVVHASPEWSKENLELDSEAVKAPLIKAFCEATGTQISPTNVWAHRWRYSLVENQLSSMFLWDKDEKLGMCGDWCGGGSVEGAFLSGLKLAETVESDFKKNANYNIV